MTRLAPGGSRSPSCGRSRRPSARSPTRRSTTSSSIARTPTCCSTGAALPRLRLRVPAAGGAADRLGGAAAAAARTLRGELRRADAGVRAGRPAARRAPGRRRRARARVVAWLLALDAGASSARRCARTSTRCRSHSRSARLLAFARERHAAGFALLGAGDDDEALPGAARRRRDRVAARPRRRARGGARGARSSPPSSPRCRCPSPATGYLDPSSSTSTARCRSSRRRRRVLFALGGSGVTGTNLRPDRFKSNGLDGGAADARRGAVRGGARARARRRRRARGARGDRPPSRALRVRRAAGVRRPRQGALAAVRHLARAVRRARVGVGPARGRRAHRRGRSCSRTSSSPAATSTSSTRTRRSSCVVAARNALLLAGALTRRCRQQDCSIASARIGSEQRTTHRHEPRVVVGGLEALGHVRDERRGSPAPCARRSRRRAGRSCRRR